jgi:hypothetical protein
VPPQERRYAAGGIADCNPVDLHALALKLLEHGCLADAWDAPASEQVEQARLAGREIR